MGRSKILKQNAPWYKQLRSEESFDDNLRERDGYNQRALKINDPYKWKHLAIWYGMVETSIGQASETELIRDTKNNIAITLEKYLLTYGMTAEIKQAILDLESWLRYTLILTKDILPHNIVVSDKDDRLVLKIVDGLGLKSFLPFASIHDLFAKRYIERRIKRMHAASGSPRKGTSQVIIKTEAKEGFNLFWYGKGNSLKYPAWNQI